MTKHQLPPSEHVIQAFDLSGQPSPIDGGQHESWLVDGAILKPTRDATRTEWVCQLHAEIIRRQTPSTLSKFRVAEPLKTIENAESCYVFDNWTATRFIDGIPDSNIRIGEVIPASREMHRILKEIVHEPHEIISSQQDRWAQADRIAWDEIALAEATGVSDQLYSKLKLYLDRLEVLKQPLSEASYENQLVHGDLSGNILFPPPGLEHTMPPAIIDFTPYWRPVEYAEAIVVADGITWQGGGVEMVKIPGWNFLRFQMLVRALIFRIVTYLIQHDEEFVSRNLPNMDVEGAVRLLENLSSRIDERL